MVLETAAALVIPWLGGRFAGELLSADENRGPLQKSPVPEAGARPTRIACVAAYIYGSPTVYRFFVGQRQSGAITVQFIGVNATADARWEDQAPTPLCSWKLCSGVRLSHYSRAPRPLGPPEVRASSPAIHARVPKHTENAGHRRPRIGSTPNVGKCGSNPYRRLLTAVAQLHGKRSVRVWAAKYHGNRRGILLLS